MKVFELKNGLKVIFHAMNNTHSVTCGLYVKAGSVFEDEKLCGITHFLEHLHFRRLNAFSQRDLYYKMESMGSTLRAATYRNFMRFTMKFVPGKIDTAIEIFAHILEACEWTEDDFEKEKCVVLNQVESQNEYITADKEARKYIFAKHGLSRNIMGDINSVEGISLHNIQDYKRQVFKASNMIFCVTGKIEENELEKSLKRLEEVSLSQEMIERSVEYPENFHFRKPEIKFINGYDSNILDVNLSFDVAHKNNGPYIVPLLNCILGEGVGSKLQCAIREELNYTSDVFSYIEEYQSFSVLHICFTVQKTKFLPCVSEIVSILKKLKEEITQEDLDVSIPFHVDNKIFLEDDTEEMNFQVAYDRFVLGKEDDSMSLLDDDNLIMDLKKKAKDIFKYNNVCLIAIGNMDGLDKQKFCDVLCLL